MRRKNQFRGSWRWQLLASAVICGGVAASENCALAQSKIVPDGTLGDESSVVVPNFRGLSVEAIDGGAQRGQNLFHSFQEFNVSEGRGAYFYSPDAGIENILARVTGGNPSEILGVLGTFGDSQPNLFLINPNGIIFGQNARLDVGGSFVASTASSVVFDNGYQFSATNPQAPPLLTVNLPLGLQFGANPGRIVNQSIATGDGLEVRPGRTLALVGGEVALEGGTIFVPDGRIELGSVAGNSQVNLTPTSTGYTLGYEGVENFQDIRLTQRAFVATNTNVGGGSIQVQGSNVTLTDGSAIANITSGAGKGGNLIVNASDSVQVIGTSADGLPSSLFTSASSTATGEPGDITITTPTLLVQGGAFVTTDTSGAGKGGSLIVNASDSVQVIGTGNFSVGQLGSQLSTSSKTGDAGDIRITTRQLLISDGASINANTLGAGKGGSVIIDASQGVQVIGRSADGQVASSLSAFSGSEGEAGNLTITTGQLLISAGALVTTGTSRAGKGGNLTVNASESVQVIGSHSGDGRFASRLTAQANPKATGDAGDLSITTGRLLILGGAQVGASTFGAGKGGNVIINASESVQVIGTSADGKANSSLSAQTEGAGDAGNLTITTGQLLIRDGAQVSTSTLGAGNGGNLTVNASESVQLIGTSADGQFISALGAQANRNSTGDAGNLTITTGQLLIRDGSQVSTGTFGTGNGGNLTVNASESVQLIGTSADSEFGSALGTQAEGTGDAGNLKITTPVLLVRDGAFVSADTFGAGKGGNLTVNASESVQVIGRSADGEFASKLSADTNPNATGDAGDLSITTARLLISDGAFVSAGTYGAGKGGNLIVNASDWVQVIGTSADGRFSSSLSTDTNRNATGDAGDLSITTARLLISDGAFVSASTSGAGKGGNLIVNASESVQMIGASIDDGFLTGLSTQAEGTGDAGNLTITTGRLLISGGAQLTAGTFGAGKGGNVTVRASQEVELIGTSADGRARSGLFTSAPDGGIAGDLSVETRQMSVRDGARVTVSSPSGQAGNLTITANSLSLNRGTILAETGQSTAEGGANITLQGLDLLRMDNESLISASALEDANGGNVTIDSTFIVATPPTGPEGSDITANAVRGNGGRVRITTQGLFGIEFQPELTPNNDITASSDFGIAGEVAINSPDVDPSRGLAELPTDVVDASEQIDRRCTPTASSTQGSTFTITGRGGLPPSPNETLSEEGLLEDLGTSVAVSDEKPRGRSVVPVASPNTPANKLVEAQGWVVGLNGTVILTAQSPTVTPHSPTLTPATCSN